MAVKINQLKKFSVKQLKAIVKDNKLGKITKKKKAQLIGMISNCDACRDILSKLSLPPKKKQKPPTAKQLAARAAFKVMVQGKKKEQPKPSLEKKGISELIDMGLDKGLKVNDSMTKQQLINAVSNGKKNLKGLQQKDLEVRQTTSVKIEIIKEAKKEIKKTMETLIEDKVLAPIENIKKIEKLGKKKFLDAIFGVSSFSLKREIKDIVNEATDEQLEIFLSFSKIKKKEVLEKRFNSSKSIGQLLNSFIK